MSSLFHLTIAVRGRRALVRGEAERRALVRALTRVGGDHLLSFCVVDDHVHLAARATRPGYVSRSLRRVVRSAAPDLELKPSHIEPIETRSHLASVIRYQLGQPEHHGLAEPSALWSGSCLPDLIGARILPGFRRRAIREELPRLRLRDLFQHLGLGAEPLAPASLARLDEAGPRRLIDLASRVFAADPTLEGRSTPILDARALAVWALQRLHLSGPRIAGHLATTRSSVLRLSRRPIHAEAQRALRLQVALTDRVSALPEPDSLRKSR